jgi:hypothetical protein
MLQQDDYLYFADPSISGKLALIELGGMIPI